MSKSENPTPPKKHIWEKSYPVDITWDTELPLDNMVTLFNKSVRDHGNRTCVTFMGKSYTYKEIGKMADRFAKGLQKDGYGPGSRVGICMPNTPYYLATYFGALKAGATVVNFNPLYTNEELENLIKDSGAEVMVTVNLEQTQPKIESMIGRTPLKKIVSCDFADILPDAQARQLKALTVACNTAQNKVFGTLLGTTLRDKVLSLREKKEAPTLLPTHKGKHIVSFDEFSKGGKLKKVIINADDVAVLQYTGGTTGLPKAAMLTHRNLSANTQQTALWFSPARTEGKQEKVMTVLPFFHVFSMTVQMNLSIHLGDHIILNKPGAKLDPAALLKLMSDEKVAIFAGVPDLYKKLMEVKGADQYDLSSLKICISGAAPLPQRTWEAWEKFTGVEIIEGYGLSETSPLVMANPLKGQKKINSIGVPVPLTEVRITNLEFPDKEEPLNVEGEICLRGPQVMKGYWNRPAETAGVMTDDGFLRTGDVGFIDEDGYVFITDRIKDMIIVNGFKAFPRHVEEAIMKHPSIAEVIVMGVNDDEKGEAVKAFIVLKPDEKVTADDLHAYLKEKLVHYELPRAKNIEFRAELPKTMIGKPDRKALKMEEKEKAAGKKGNGPKAP